MKSKKPGRPRSRPDDLVVFNAQMTTKAKERLKALAQVEGKHAYTLLEDGFWQFWESLEDDKRSAAEQIVSILEKSRDERE